MSDIVNSRNLQHEINNRLDNLQKRIPRCKESKGAYFELQDLKGWVIDNQQANGDNKEQEQALHLRGVVFNEAESEVEVCCATCVDHVDNTCLNGEPCINFSLWMQRT